MYIAEIDDILNETINNFMGTWILENKAPELLEFKKLVKEINFVKYQKQINSIIELAQSLIPMKKINNLVTKNQNIILIKNLVSKFIGYYLFIILGINYNGKIEQFNNNLIEFSRNQPNYSLKIDNFFNTETNSNIIKTVNLINEFMDYIDKMTSKKDTSNLIDNYSYNLKEFIQKIGEENVIKNIAEALSAEKNKIIVDHSIILMMIQLVLYTNKEKNEIFDIIEGTETASGDFIFIDVVVPRSDFIDYSAIESILSPTQLKTNLPETIYSLINEDYSEDINEKRKYFTDHDIKIQKLLDTHILIPIVDDFLLYHKDNEKYEKQGDKLESPKKKDETKVKYIINKINTVSEYYKNPNEIKKLFYVPLQETNATLTNTYEDIKIISKMKNIIKMNTENLDLLNDLISYRLYPYISFKDFKNNGFVFSSDKTIDAIRNVSINSINKKKFDVLQTRIMSEDMLVNIIGFAFVNKESELNCLNINTFIDICKDTDEPLNSIKTLINYKLKKKIFSKEKLETDELTNNYYWLFDLSKQKYNIPFYDISDSMPKNEVVKIITAYLYDYTIESVINIIREQVNISHPKLITDYIDMVDNFKIKYPDINNPQHSKDLNELEYLIYYTKSIKVGDTYDYNEDEFPGLYGDIIKLPTAPPKKYPKIPVLNVVADFPISDSKDDNKNTFKETNINQDDYDSKDNEHVDAVCQHIISWDKISELNKNKDFKYSELVYEFIQQFVNINAEQDFICKSCRSAINIKKYIQDGQFDNATQMFVTFSMKYDIELEEIPEYEKFKTSIRNIDKIIERMASIFNFQSLKGSTYLVKGNRKTIIKDVMDIVLFHNTYMDKNYTTQVRENMMKKFGTTKISNLFKFQLDNNVFIYSSKDKDYYKILKYNNVLTYILIILILEMNDSQIMTLTNDKYCSYYIFKKIGFSLFNNLNIVINKTGDMAPLSDYPILCYMIYLTSCLITRYNIWIDVSAKEVKSSQKKFSSEKVLTQKAIINTFVELINTILLVDSDIMKAKKSFIYEVLQTKYYFKLELYKSIELTRKLDKTYLQIESEKEQKGITLGSTKFDLEPNNDVFNQFTFDDLYDKFSRKISLERLIPKYYPNIVVKIYEISNLTNCIDGRFHNFVNNGTLFTCQHCKENADPTKLIPDSIKLLYQREIILYLRKLATKYCINGDIHQFEYDSKKDISICSKCKYTLGTPITNSDKELFNMYNIIEKYKKENNIKSSLMIKELENKNTADIFRLKKIFDKIMYKYQKYDNDINKTINKVLDSIQKLLGIDIIVNNNVYNLHHNIYYIDHDYNGVKLESPIQIYEKENKFRIIESHPHFKRNVIVYSMQRNTKYELFYDLLEKNLLGYREINKEYIDLDKNNCKLKINYSIKNMLLMFGLPRQQINISDVYPEIYGMTKEDIENHFEKNKNFTMYDFISKVCIRRFNLIKKLGYELNKYINRFKYKYTVNILTTEFINPNNNQTVVISEPSNNPIDLLYVNYQKKLDSDIQTDINDKNNKHIFLKYINDILTYMPFSIKNDKKDNIKFSNFIDYNFILKNDNTTNLILNYILDEILRLIEYNTNKATKTNVAHFVIDVICILFNQYNFDTHFFNKELSNFHQILYTSPFYLETQNADLMMDAIDFYAEQREKEDFDKLSPEEQERIREQKYDDEEEAQGMDIGDDILDDEGRFDFYSNYQFIDNIKNMIKENILPPGDYY